MAADTRINDRIRAAEIRLIGPEGEQLGIMSSEVALERARDAGLDLVEVAPQAEPPVCRLMDYGKWKYEQDVRAREARKRQTQVTVKEMKYRIKISDHDFQFKTRQVEKFLNAGSKVKITVMFRGREMAHPELGDRLMKRLAAELADVSTVEQHARLDGRNMVMVVAPLRKPGAKSKAGDSAEPADKVKGTDNAKNEVA